MKDENSTELKNLYKEYNNKNIVLEELTGLPVRVFSCKDINKIGISGIVYKETKNTIKIKAVCGIKTVPKIGSEFNFKIGKNLYKVKGEEINFRPYERIKKSIKFYNKRKLKKD